MSPLNKFNRIAVIYDLLNQIIFGKTITNAQKVYFPFLGQCKNLLVLGGGSGTVFNDLLKQHPNIRVTYIEASDVMLLKAKRNLQAFESRVICIHGTEDHIPNTRFDGVITNFFFDLFTEEKLIAVMTRIETSLQPQSVWVVTDFTTTKVWWQKLLLKTMYVFFNVVAGIEAHRIPGWQNLLGKYGFGLKSSSTFCSGFIKAELYERSAAIRRSVFHQSAG